MRSSFFIWKKRVTSITTRKSFDPGEISTGLSIKYAQISRFNYCNAEHSHNTAAFWALVFLPVADATWARRSNTLYFFYCVQNGYEVVSRL